jgi:hypothetical protein
MSWLSKIVRSLFLVKEIKSKMGEVHFRRYRLIQTKWFAVYIHQILRSDQDRDMHDHPWNFTSVILEGAYREASSYPPLFDKVYVRDYYSGDVIEHKAEDAHKLTLVSDQVWTLVFVSGRERVWGYQTPSGWVPHDEYRKMKNSRAI